MVKNRFTTIDVTAVVSNVRDKCLGMRASNIYDLNPKTYVIKLALNEKKYSLLLESGVRLHTTKYMRDKPKIPSVFTLKLRKHLRTKRLESIRQLGIDRVIDLQFGSGEAAYHLIIELHSRGNIILCDKDYFIVTLLRTFKYHEDDVLVAVKQKYPVDMAQGLRVVSADEILRAVQECPEPSGTSIKQLLIKTVDYSPEVIAHGLTRANIGQNTKLTKIDPSQVEALSKSLVEAGELQSSFQVESPKGYIVLHSKRNANANAAAAATTSSSSTSDAAAAGGAVALPDAAAFDAFVPFLYAQYNEQEYLEFACFDEAVDEFFAKIESQKIDVQRSTQENLVSKKLQKVRADQHKRIVDLEGAVEQSHFKARLIQANLEDVEKAILIIRSAIANSVDWAELARIVKEEQKNGDPIANMIYKLRLDQNQISLLLSDTRFEDADEDELTATPTEVDVDISLSAHANAQLYFNQKKQSEVKKQKTSNAVEQALKAAEKKARVAMKEVKIKANIQKVRKTLWFEKFYWFISTDNYLVISGRDAQQNEQLVKRYMRKGDLYVHADLHGASSCIIKNPTAEPVPPATLMQAGANTVCRSAAWNAKVVTSAWWVYNHQVSKTAPTGEYLTTGSFMIRGKKNFLPPVQLVMGLALMFRLDDSFIERHLQDRRKALDGGEQPLSDSTSSSALLSDDEFEDDEIAPLEGDSDGEEDAAGGSAAAAAAEEEDDYEHAAAKTTIFSADEEVDAASLPSAEAPPRARAAGGLKSSRSSSASSTSASSRATRGTSGETEFQPALVGIPAKYRLDLSMSHEDATRALDQEAADAAAGDTDASVPRKKKLSKHERKLLKLASPGSSSEQPNNEAEEASDSDESDGDEQPATQPHEQPEQAEGESSSSEDEETEEASATPATAPTPSPAPSPAQPVVAKDKPVAPAGGGGKAAKGAAPPPKVRGKSKKAKKLQQKYADQDEEDRQARLRLLGHDEEGHAIPAKMTKKKAKVAAKSSQQERKQQQQQQQQQQRKKGGGGSGGKPPGGKGAAAAAGGAGGGAGGEGIDEEEREQRRLMKEEELQQLADEALESISLIDSLTGVPREDDVLQFAIPVCAPYAALQGYKYKVKLTPGGVKKGKAGKTCLAVFAKQAAATPQEKDLLKAISDNELFIQMIGNVKLSTPGFSKVAGKKKGGKAQ